MNYKLCELSAKTIINSLLLILFFLFTLAAHGQERDNDFLISYVDSSSGKELYGYKTPAGKIIIKAKYIIAADDTMRAMAFVVSEDSGWIGIDRHDHVILKPFIFDNGPDYLEEGLFRFVENDKIGFANLDGQKIIPAQFDFAEPFENGIAAYTLGGHRQNDGEHWIWVGGYESGYINKSGQRFKEVTKLKHGTREAWTNNNGHVLLNKNGQIIKAYGD